jgi:NTP pyrophosphatase (non-canonical NTP hydrolase)
MELNQYQAAALGSAIYPNIGNNIYYPAFKLAGEVGEVTEKLGKYIRDNQITDFNNLASGFSDEFKLSLVKELGDVLWYIAALSNELKVDLNTVAEKNIEKLTARVKNNTLTGSGDDR